MKQLITIIIVLTLGSCQDNSHESNNLIVPTVPEDFKSSMESQTASLIADMTKLGINKDRQLQILNQSNRNLSERVNKMNDEIYSLGTHWSEDVARMKIDSVKSVYGFFDSEKNAPIDYVEASRLDINRLIEEELQKELKK